MGATDSFAGACGIFAFFAGASSTTSTVLNMVLRFSPMFRACNGAMRLSDDANSSGTIKEAA